MATQPELPAGEEPLTRTPWTGSCPTWARAGRQTPAHLHAGAQPSGQTAARRAPDRSAGRQRRL